MLISLCMMVKNEEANLPRALASVRAGVDQIVLNDTGSTDRTLEIARAFEAKIIETGFTGDFSHHRNITLDAADGEHLFVMDADEEVVDTDFEELRHHLASGQLPPVCMVREVLRYPEGREVTMLAPRVFRADAGIRYKYPIHEQLDVDNLQAVLSNVTLVHHGYETPGNLEVKERRNLALAEAMPDGIHAYHCRARAAMTLKEWEKLLCNARALVEAEPTATLVVEGCALGGAAAYRLGRQADFEYFLARGQEAVPYAPDVLFLETIKSLKKYSAALEANGDSPSSGTFLRPWTFWHDRGQVDLMLEVLLGRRRLT